MADTGLKSVFAQINGQDLARILTPYSAESEARASGPPLSLGVRQEVADLSKWPETPAGRDSFEPLLRIIKPGYLGNLAKGQYERVLSVIPEKVILKSKITVSDEWHKEGAQHAFMIPHVDGSLIAQQFTFLTTFPNTTYFFPDILLSKFKEERLHKSFDPAQHMIYRPAPGEEVMFNDDHFPHMGPQNTREEFAAAMAVYERSHILTDGNQQFRRLKVATRVVLDRDWTRENSEFYSPFGREPHL